MALPALAPAAPRPPAGRSWFHVALAALYAASFAALAALLVQGLPFYSAPPGERAHHEGYWQWKPGGSTGRVLGVAGATLMTLMLLYSARKRLKALRGLALANVGQRDEAEAIAAELERSAAQPVPLGVGPTAALLWCLGRRERAVELFERGFEDHAPLVWSYPLWVPGLGGLASDPCWPALLETVGLGHLAVARS